jgi:DnaJ-class molecular chaperone
MQIEVITGQPLQNGMKVRQCTECLARGTWRDADMVVQMGRHRVSVCESCLVELYKLMDEQRCVIRYNLAP